MAKPLEPREVVTIQEIALSNIYEIEALIEVLRGQSQEESGGKGYRAKQQGPFARNARSRLGLPPESVKIGEQGGKKERIRNPLPYTRINIRLTKSEGELTKVSYQTSGFRMLVPGIGSGSCEVANTPCLIFLTK